MKYVLLSALLFVVYVPVFSQLFEDSFQSYKSKKELSYNWIISSDFDLDTVVSKTKSIKITTLSTMLLKVPKMKLGKAELRIFTKGIGLWNIEVYTGSSIDFDDSSNWTKVNEIKIISPTNNFNTNTIDINKVKNTFVKFRFSTDSDNTELYIDNVVIKKITKEAEEEIIAELQQKKLKQEREKDFKSLMTKESYKNAIKLVDSYKLIYKSRIYTIGMLYDKSKAIELVSGTAAALGDYNQLSNPLRYSKFSEFKKLLYSKLEPIDKLYFTDEIEGKLAVFYQKIKNPLNIALGVGDIFTGGAVSKIIGSFKSMIIKGFGTERLKTLYFLPSKIKQEKNAGILLYNNAKVFFNDIEKQNDITLRLNKEILIIYKNAEELNGKIEQLFFEYFEIMNIVISRNKLLSVIKNQNYNYISNPVDQEFQRLTDYYKTDINVRHISEKVKKIDFYLNKIDNLIKEYEYLSNRMSSFYADFNKLLSKECPYKNLPENDKRYWNLNVNKIKQMIRKAEDNFNELYNDVNFKKTVM